MFKQLMKLLGGGDLPIDPLELMRAAENGNVEAQFEVAKQHYQEYGNPQNDYKKAFYWFNKAAEQGHVEAQYYVGQMYDTGRGVERDAAQAFTFFSKAAHQDHVASQFDLGVMYKNGEGVKRDFEKAKLWFSKAAKQGHVQAKKWEKYNFHAED